MSSARGRVLQLYRGILRTARTWQGGQQVSAHCCQRRLCLSPKSLTAHTQIMHHLLLLQEQEYIRQEARTQFKQHKSLQDAAEIEAKASGSVRWCPVFTEQAAARIGHKTDAFPCVAGVVVSTTTFLVLQIKEAQDRLQIGVHYQIPYPRIHHAPQFKRRQYLDIPIIK